MTLPIAAYDPKRTTSVECIILLALNVSMKDLTRFSQ